jgi:hypothetical protein
MTAAFSTTDPSTVTVRVPIHLRKRGCRKLIITESGHQITAPTKPQIDSTLLRALVQAFRWKALLDAGKYATISELAAAEKMNISYVAHILKLTILAPDIVEATLDGKQPRGMLLQPLMRAIPADWNAQRKLLS